MLSKSDAKFGMRMSILEWKPARDAASYVPKVCALFCFPKLKGWESTRNAVNAALRAVHALSGLRRGGFWCLSESDLAQT